MITFIPFLYTYMANRESTARIDLAQYTAFMIVGNPSLSKDTYHQRKLEIGRNLKHGIDGLTSSMEYFSIHGHLESIPLSVLVLHPDFSLSKH